MNKRLRELEALATETVNCGINGTSTSQYFDRRRFAELIVRECAKVAEDYVGAENNKLVETVYISSWQLQDAIKEHFGVDK